ncbi:MAG: TolB family protein [Acidimicrobiia bacterium]
MMHRIRLGHRTWTTALCCALAASLLAACSDATDGTKLYPVDQSNAPAGSVSGSGTGGVKAPVTASAEACASLTALTDANRAARTAKVPMPLADRQAIDADGQAALRELGTNAGALAIVFVWLAEVEEKFDGVVQSGWAEDGFGLQQAADEADARNIVEFLSADNPDGIGSKGMFVNGAFITVDEYAARWDGAVTRLWFACHAPPVGWKVLTEDTTGPSPAGALMYTRPGDAGSTLHRMDLGVRTDESLATDSPDVTSPRLSPVGDLLALVEGDRSAPGVLTVKASDGSPARTLTAPADEASCPSWRSDGAAILVRRRTPQPSGVGRWELASIDLASGSTVAVTQPGPTRLVGCGGVLADGTVIAPVVDPTTATSVLAANPDGESQVLVALDDCSIATVTPAPDSAHIAFSTNCVDPYGDGLWIVPATGGTPTRIATGEIQGIGWAPDSTWLTFAHHPVGVDEPDALWTIQPDGKYPLKLDPGPVADPTWDL